MDWLTTQTDFDYDAAGRLITQTNGNGTTVSRQYDVAGRLTNLQNKKSGGSVITSHTFTLDKVGNRTGVSETVPLNPLFTNQSLTFAHNAGHQLISDGVRAYTYDNNGNRISSNDGVNPVTYAYNAKDRLTAVQRPAQTDTYNYNGDGRWSRPSGTAQKPDMCSTAAGMPNMLAETDTAGTIQNYFIHGNGLLYAIKASDESYSVYHYDAVGNTLALSDGAELSPTTRLWAIRGGRRLFRHNP